jgi:hypothetical protein
MNDNKYLLSCNKKKNRKYHTILEQLQNPIEIKIGLTPSCFIEVSITTPESNCYVYYVLGGIEFALVSTIFRLDFVTVLR